jgi:hypothetical protein
MIYGYLGNPKLRKAFINISLTQHELDEYRKCAKDPIYFIRNYMKIVVLGKGIQPFDMYPFQEDMIHTFQDNRFVICKIPRQSGKSITTVAYLLHTIIFNENYNIAILAHKGSAANGILQRLKLAYENLPRWLQSGIIEWNKGNIELENGSKISAYATAADGLRSGSFDLVFLDEFAFVPTNVAEAFFTSTYPVITAGTDTKMIIVSTPKGMNHYFTMWSKAIQKKSEYVPIEVHWSAVPDRDEKWKEETIRNTSPEQFQQEFETEFLGSTNTLISSAKLKQLLVLAENPIRTIDNLSIYEEPIPGHTYTMTIDVAEGLGLDYSTMQVIDVTTIPYKQVAKYRNNQISPYLFPTAIIQVAKKYNEAFVLVEINSIGLQVSDTLHFEFGYENLIKIEQKGKQGQITTPGFKRRIAYGLKISNQTKMIGCANLKTMIESDKLIVRDEDTLKEFTTFTGEKKTFKAEEGKNDDLVIGLVHFGWLTGQRYFKDNINNNIRELIQKEQMDLMDVDICPPPIIDNGLNQGYEEFDGDRWIEDKKSKYNYTKEMLQEELKRRNPFDSFDDWRSSL